ncbi:hypothetical protein BSL78_24921 [Apostichopus japonicus]|uniref:Exosome complex component RRP45 n=1 Tax=Stichopus japonicus TaxID=307972 RepID=A0A2G8JR43_STIJA|nr:hypothetical protein BSL78_24921 [Apostichopus japonicus]
MKVIVSAAEKQFINSAIASGKRLDGRDTYDYRKVRITYGTERGCCEVQVGETRVLAQTSCEVVKPSGARPSEGMLHINLELSPMASPTFEPGRMSSFGVELNRLLERSVRESKAVDTESLCIVVGVKVWQVRVDLHALNFDGNLLDCSSIAAIASLHHFRRPEVTVSGEQVTIHSLEDREPVALSIHHMPICVTFAFFQEGKYLLVDPSDREESVMDGTMVVCMNIHRELCTVQMTGSMLLLKDQLSRCCQIAIVKVSEITEVIKSALANDAQARKEGRKHGFAESKVSSRITTGHMEEQTIPIKKEVDGSGSEDEMEDEEEEEEANGEEKNQNGSDVKIDSPGVGTIGEGLRNTWGVPTEDSDDNGQDTIMEEKATTEADDKRGGNKSCQKNL